MYVCIAIGGDLKLLRGSFDGLANMFRRAAYLPPSQSHASKFITLKCVAAVVKQPGIR